MFHVSYVCSNQISFLRNIHRSFDQWRPTKLIELDWQSSLQTNSCDSEQSHAFADPLNSCEPYFFHPRIQKHGTSRTSIHPKTPVYCLAPRNVIAMKPRDLQGDLPQLEAFLDFSVCKWYQLSSHFWKMNSITTNYIRWASKSEVWFARTLRLKRFWFHPR